MEHVETKGLRVAFAQPLYSQVRAQVLKRISAGEWGAGESLPNEFSLAAEYRVSVGTIRRAVEGLEKEGMLVRKQGRGTFVAGTGRTPMQDKYTAIRKIDGTRSDIGYELEGVRRRSIAREEAALLGCSADSEVLEIEQAVLMGESVVGIETSVVAADLFPRMETQLSYGQHLYPVFNLYGLLVTRASDTISVVETGERMARRFGRGCGSHMLRVKRIAFTHADQPLEVRIAHYNPVRVAYATGIV